jgi:hypothetical protein
MTHIEYALLSVLCSLCFLCCILLVFVFVWSCRFEWAGDQEEARLDTWTAAQLEEAQFAPLDLQYVATR